MIARHLGGRDRRMVKNKFKREERTNSREIEYALSHPVVPDPEEMEELLNGARPPPAQDLDDLDDEMDAEGPGLWDASAAASSAPDNGAGVGAGVAAAAAVATGIGAGVSSSAGARAHEVGARRAGGPR